MAFKFFVIFVVGLFLDGLVLPAFFSLRESFFFLLILIVPLLYTGSTGSSAAYGFTFAIILESFRGLEFGALALPFLFVAVIIYLIQRFLNAKYTHDTRFNLSKMIFVVLTSVVFTYAFFIFYKGGVNLHYLNIVIGLTVALEAFILVFVFNIVFNKKTDYM